MKSEKSGLEILATTEGNNSESNEQLCTKAFSGGYNYGDSEGIPEPCQEDDLASTMKIGLAEFPRSLLKPLET